MPKWFFKAIVLSCMVTGGAILSGQHVIITGSVKFISNSAYQGGAIDSDANVTIAYSSRVGFKGNHAKTYGGAIDSLHHVTIGIGATSPTPNLPTNEKNVPFRLLSFIKY